MSALTFDTLSAELTQALGEQSQLPHAPTVRCTLGRDKVMVLVEYPLDSAQAEPAATPTLDWLEQSLRHQFDTTGLPEEAADLSGISSALTVQLFLKHISEPKPFTMRSFVWKVDDGFDDLFGEPFVDAGMSRGVTSPVEQFAAMTTSGGGANYGRSATKGTAQSLQAIEPPEAERPDLPVAYFQAEELVPAELDDTHLPLDLEPDAAFAPLPDSTEALDGELSEAPLEVADADLEGKAHDGFTDDAIEGKTRDEFSTKDGNDASDNEARDEISGEVEDNFEPDVGVDAVLSVGGFGLADELELYSETSLDEELAVGLPELNLPVASATDFELPGESPKLESSDDFNLPTLDLPGASVPEITSADADFFNLEGTESGFDEAAANPSPFGMDLTAVLESSRKDDETTAVEGQEIGVLEYELLDGGSDGLAAEGEDYLTLEDALAATRQTDVTGIDDAIANTDFTTDDRATTGRVPDNLGVDDLEAEDRLDDESDSDVFEGFKSDGLESDGYKSDGYESEEEYEVDADSPYYLESDTSEDAPSEDVAWVDEEEVQRQREQWQQQSKSGNPWVFAGLIGFLVLGLLGFVFTRPCTFGQCDRLQTAQLNNAKALSDLRVDSSAKGVTAAKQQLKRSIGLLSPIPIWSSYYDDAQAVLPDYEGQVRALDYVSASQEKAYSAAVKSQDPPHTVSTWQEIAAEWLAASERLEQVPLDSPVREVANQKLIEYRANRATILVRIEAESKAEVGLRQAQQAAGLATKQSENATSLEDWEAALSDWETAVDNLSQIPQGTKAHAEAQKLLPDYLKSLDAVRDRTEKERLASRSLFEAKQFAADAQRAETEEQWSASVQGWKSAQSKLQGILPNTLAHAEAQAMKGIYAESVKKSENNLQVALRFRPIEPSFFSACGVSSTQKCTYSVRSGNVRLDLFEGYDDAIDQIITPPDERATEASFAQVSEQSAVLLQTIAKLGMQAQVPIEMYDTEGEFMAMYRPDVKGFTR